MKGLKKAGMTESGNLRLFFCWLMDGRRNLGSSTLQLKNTKKSF